MTNVFEDMGLENADLLLEEAKDLTIAKLREERYAWRNLCKILRNWPAGEDLGFIHQAIDEALQHDAARAVMEKRRDVLNRLVAEAQKGGEYD